MKYNIVFTKSAQKDIQKLDELVKVRIRKKIEYFIKHENPLQFATTLVDSEIGAYRWRVGLYRIVFDVENNCIIVLRIRHRRDVYK